MSEPLVPTLDTLLVRYCNISTCYDSLDHRVSRQCGDESLQTRAVMEWLMRNICYLKRGAAHVPLT